MAGAVRTEIQAVMKKAGERERQWKNARQKERRHEQNKAELGPRIEEQRRDTLRTAAEFAEKQAEDEESSATKVGIDAGLCVVFAPNACGFCTIAFFCIHVHLSSFYEKAYAFM